MSHHHHHHGSRCADDVAMDRRFLATIVLNAVIAIAEFAGGIVAGSLAMLSDAAHNLGDVAAIVLALVARKLGRRPPTARHTMFLEGAPRDVDIARLADAVESAFSPACLHHVHVWAISPNQRLLTAHVALGQEMTGSEIEILLVRIKEFLHQHWAINHCTLEPEVAGCGQVELLGRWDCVSMETCCSHHHPTNPNRSKSVVSVS